MSAQDHIEVNKFLTEANEIVEKGFSTAALVANAMNSMKESSIAAKRVFTYNPNNKQIHKLFPNYSPLIQTILNMIEQNTKKIAIKDNDPNSWISLGHCYLMIGDFPNAFSAYARAQRLITKNANVYFWYAIGIVYHHYNYKDHAQSCFNQVLQEGYNFPYYSDLLFRNAILARSSGKFVEALQFFEMSRTNPPKGLVDADVVFQIGYTYQLMKKDAEALAVYQTLYQNYPNSMPAVEQYAWFLYLNDKAVSKEGLNAIIQRALEQEPDEENLLMLSARIALSGNNTDEAYNKYIKSLHYWSDNGYFLCALGYLYYKNKQEKDASFAFLRAVQIKPDIEQAWLNLGLYYEQMHEMTNALNMYKSGKINCEGSKELQRRIASINKKHPLPQVLDVEDASFFEDAPKKFADEYIAAVPVLPSFLFGKDVEKLNFEELSTFPSSLFA